MSDTQQATPARLDRRIQIAAMVEYGGPARCGGRREGPDGNAYSGGVAHLDPLSATNRPDRIAKTD